MKKIFYTLLCACFLLLGATQVFAATYFNHSSNWSGYVAKGGQYTSVGGTWIVPSVSSLNVQSGDATWVGIGGSLKQDLIQSGTEAVINSSGQISYIAWYELLPNSAVQFPISVKAGDSVTVLVSEISGDSWHISFVDNTTGKSVFINVNYASSLSSAEWIEEIPTINKSLTVLDSFGVMNFTHAYAVKDGTLGNIASVGGKILKMINNKNQVIASPSPLGSDDASFSVTRMDTDSSIKKIIQIFSV